ncbi:MAG: response regulator, partial [Nitrospiraceae bacterium]
HRRKILVIDDDQSVCDMFARTLNNRGYEVYTETHFQGGIKKAKEVLPDLVFISLLLDTTNGLKASKEIHAIEKLGKVPVVMLISSRGELDPKYTVTIGIVDVLVKPPAEKDIVSITEDVLGIDAGRNTEAETISAISASENIRAVPDLPEDREQVEKFDIGSKKGPAKKKLEYDDAYRDIPEEIDKDVNQNQEYASQSGYVLRDQKGSSEELPDESGFDEVAEGIDESSGSGESDSEALYDEDQDVNDDLEMQEDVEDNPVHKAGGSGSGRKILLLAAALVLIAVIGIGTYMGLQFLFGAKDRTVVVQSSEVGSSVTDKRELKKKEAESSPASGNVPTDSAVETKKGRAAVPKHSPAVKVPKASAVQKKGTFSVQVGFFGNLKNAEVFAVKMKQRGYKVFIMNERKAAGEKSYRVLVGKFRNRNDALKLSKAILRKERIETVLYKE